MFRSLLQIATVLFLSRANGQIIDLYDGAEVTGTYLESGFTTLSPGDKISISTTNAFTNPVVFLSAVFSQNGYSDSIPVEARVIELVDNAGVAAVVSFNVMLVWPSNKTCVSEWNDGGAPQGSYTVGWYVGERGGYTVSGVQVEFMTATVKAADFNLVTWLYTFGIACNYPTLNGDNDYSPGAIFTIQSNNNAAQYLTVRTKHWFKTEKTKCAYAWAGGEMRLYPHEYDSAAGLIDPSQIQDETVGVFLFDTRFPQSLDCVGGSYLEIGQLPAFNSDPHQFSMYQAVDTSVQHVGLFGTVLSFEGGDALTIKAYSTTSSPTHIFGFIQEDMCADQETYHYDEAFSYILSTPSTNTGCDSSAPILGEHTFSPTLLPSHSPTKDELEGSEGTGSSSADDGDILLAVFLPICIIVVVAIVGVVTKKVFFVPPPADSSEHSGLNLMP